METSMNLSLRTMRKIFLLAFAVVFGFTSRAETRFVDEVMLIGGTKAEVVEKITTYITQGWTFIDQDLNDGAGGDYVILLYKKSSSGDGFNYGSITGFILSNDYSTKLTYDGRTYYPVPCAGGEDFVDGHGDLNEGCGANSDYIYLYYTRDIFQDHRVVSGISFNSTQSGGVRLVNGNSGYDLNSGAGGDYIYMHVSTITALEPVRIGDGSSGTDKIPFIFSSSTKPYSLSQQIYTAEDIGTAGTISAIAFYHRQNESLSMDNVQIYMKHTEKDSFSGTQMEPMDDFTKVYEGQFSISGSGWITVLLDTPFEYDGNRNLMICCHDQEGGQQPVGHTFTYHDASNMARFIGSQDAIDLNQLPETNSYSSMRNDIRINITPNPYRNPINLAVTSFTDKTASLTWSAPNGTHPAIQSYEWQYKLSDAANWSNLSSTLETTASINGLSAFTEYMFRVRIIYSGGESSFSILRFATALELPYDCGFENGMPGWSQVDHNHYYNVELTGISEEAGHDGNYGYMFRCYESDPVPQYLISPGLPGDKEISVSFYYRNFAGSSPETFRVGYSTSTNDVGAFTWGDEITADGTEWWQYRNNFPAGTQYVAVKYVSNAYRLYLDDFEFVEYSAYEKPAGLSVDELGENSVKLIWTAPDGATGYAYQYRRVNDNGWSAETSVNSSYVTLGSLLANTLYDFRVKAIFGSKASNYETLRFQTEGPMESLPHTQGFENGMGGWRLVEGYGRSGITTNQQRGGTCSFEFDEGSPHAQYLRSPLLEGNSAKIISFYYKNYSQDLGGDKYTVYESRFRVGWSTGTNRLADFQEGVEVEAAAVNWTRYALQVPEDTRYIYIKTEDNEAWLYIDDISITDVPKPMATRATVMGEIHYVATFYDGSMGWQLPEEALAYTAEREGEDIVFYCFGDVIPAGRPAIILMHRTPGDTGVNKEIELTAVNTAGTGARPNEILRGSDSPLAVNGGKIGGKDVYVLGIVNGELGFYPFSGNEIPAGKAYYLAE